MIMDLLNEAIDYLRANDLITVPGVAAESLHMTMMSPRGAADVAVLPRRRPHPRVVSDRHDGLRRADAEHARQQPRLLARDGVPRDDPRPQPRRLSRPALSRLSRRISASGGPFYGEGWPLYWELTMYELGFDKTPEQKVGALFWRMHRCARIIFSLNFHMGQWSPQECVDFLVDKVGHERDNADGRSAPLVRVGAVREPAALPGGVSARRPAAARPAQGAGRHEGHDEQAVPRRDHAAGQHADRAHPPRA